MKFRIRVIFCLDITHTQPYYLHHESVIGPCIQRSSTVEKSNTFTKVTADDILYKWKGVTSFKLVPEEITNQT